MVDRRMVYITYQIWLSRHSLVFDDEVIPARRVLERTVCFAQEYCQFDTATPSLDIPDI